MNSSARFQIHVPDDDREPVDATDDYGEAVEMCRALVDEEGYARAEVRQGTRLCCAVDRDRAGRVRVRDAGAADDTDGTDDADDASPLDDESEAGPAPSAGEEDVTHRLLVSGTADRHTGEAPRGSFLGESQGGSPTRWLGL